MAGLGLLIADAGSGERPAGDPAIRSTLADDDASGLPSPRASPSRTTARETPSSASPPPEASRLAVVGGTAPPGWMSPPLAPEPCPPATVRVADGDALRAALAAAGPGTVIELAPGVYRGRFTIDRPADSGARAWLCGEPGAALDGGNVRDGVVLHLDGADRWTVQGLTVREGLKGVMVDDSARVELRGLRVHTIGDEAIHVRRHSTGARIVGNVVSDTGLREPEFGEGIYVGSAHSNWCRYTDCEPDRSDGALIADNLVFATTAEPIDIKEGTTGGVIERNQLDGSKITGPVPDSWVALKGNDWLVRDNHGEVSPRDGFQVTRVRDGWGLGNVLEGNTGRLGSDDGVLVATPE